MSEHHRIPRYFAPLSVAEPGSFGLKDDAAQLMPPPGTSLILTTDSVIEGIHVLPGATPEQYATKLIRRNLSDLAAMGAKPWRYLVNLHLPKNATDAWVAAFAASLMQEQTLFGMTLIGGDSTSGATHIHTTMTCIGLLSTAPLLRSGAQPGDDVYVSGTIGDAALGLMLLNSSPHRGEVRWGATSSVTEKISPPPNLPPMGGGENFLTSRYHCPEPRLALGNALHGIATAAIDISDGLIADAGQLAAASGVAIALQQSTVPLSDAAASLLTTHPALWEKIVSGGDDYELLFAAPPSAYTAIEALSQRLALPLTRIGAVFKGDGVKLMDAQGKEIPIAARGWEHG